MGHIKLDRKMLDWEWYKDVNTCRLFLHCLLKANWRDGRFQGVDIPRGSFVTSYQTLADETGLTVKSIRTALEHLKRTGEVAVNRQSKFSVVTVKNYCLYQSEGTVMGSQGAVSGQSAGSQGATIEEKKEYKKGRNNSIVHFVPPTLEDVSGYCRENGYKIDAQRFIDFYSSKGWMVGKNKMEDWKATVRNWSRQDKQTPQKIVRTTGFSNFDQRDYDFDELEAQLLSSQKGD